MQPANEPLDRLDSHGLLSLRLSWPAWSRNLLDEQYRNRRGRDFLGNQYVSYGEPRTHGIEVTFAFP